MAHAAAGERDRQEPSVPLSPWSAAGSLPLPNRAIAKFYPRSRILSRRSLRGLGVTIALPLLEAMMIPAARCLP
jgi:hypothetical protein